jgi:hypothetical protein
MKYRIFALGLAVIAFAGTGAALAAGPAQATTASPGAAAQPPAAADPFHICLLHKPHSCLKSNGAGKQVTITNDSADYANFHAVRTSTYRGSPAYQFDNGQGKCLRAGETGAVKFENGTCAKGDTADWWANPIVDGVSYLLNVGGGADMLTHGVKNGDRVWWGAPVSGDWASWKF